MNLNSKLPASPPVAAWRETLAYSFPGVLGFCAYLLMAGHGRGALGEIGLVLSAIVIGFYLQFGAMAALVIAEHSVQSVAGVPPNPSLIGNRHALSAAAALLIAVWFLGRYWVARQETYLLQCARESEQGIIGNPYMEPNTPESVVRRCLQIQEQRARLSDTVD